MNSNIDYFSRILLEKPPRSGIYCATKEKYGYKIIVVVNERLYNQVMGSIGHIRRTVSDGLAHSRRKGLKKDEVMKNKARLINNYCKQKFNLETMFTDELLKDLINGGTDLVGLLVHCIHTRIKDLKSYRCEGLSFIKLSNGKISVSEKVGKYSHKFTMCKDDSEFKSCLRSILTKRINLSGIA